MTEDRDQSRYMFVYRAECPYCGSTETLATSTRGQVQYRKCQAEECRGDDDGRRTFKVIGVAAGDSQSGSLEDE